MRQYCAILSAVTPHPKWLLYVLVMTASSCHVKFSKSQEQPRTYQAVIIKDTTTTMYNGQFCDVKTGVVFSYINMLDEGGEFLQFQVNQPLASCSTTGYIAIKADSVELLPNSPEQLLIPNQILQAYPQLSQTYNANNGHWETDEAGALSFISPAQLSPSTSAPVGSTGIYQPTELLATQPTFNIKPPRSQSDVQLAAKRPMNAEDNPWNFDGIASPQLQSRNSSEPAHTVIAANQSPAQPKSASHQTQSSPQIAHIPIPKLTDYAGLGAVFPLAQSPLQDFTSGIRRFGAYRQGGWRLHAGVDLYTAYGTPVYSITDGIILDSYYFAEGTYAHEVDHHKFIIRYCELKYQAEKLNQPVALGEVLGEVGDLTHTTQHMIHLEMYKGSATGNLTPSGAKPPFRRRADLVNPTQFMSDLEALIPQP